MNIINSILGVPLGYIMHLAYELTGSFFAAVLIFALIVRIILLPINIVAHLNSIRLLKLQPQLDKLKRRYSGEKERLSEAQYGLFKKEKYNPLTGLVPLFVQLLILIGVLQVMYHPLQHVLRFDPGTIAAYIKNALDFSPQATPEGAGLQLYVASILSLIDLSFAGINLGAVPSLANPSAELIVPVLSGASALAYCMVQNALSPGALSQSKKTNLSLTLFTVAFSVYFAAVTPSGVGVYWTVANILSIGVLFLLELMYSPKKLAGAALGYMAAARKTPEQLREEKTREKALKLREKQDAAKFTAANKKLVFYALSGGQYKYYKTTIDYLLEHSDATIHYLTNDPDDAVFEKYNTRHCEAHRAQRAVQPPDDTSYAQSKGKGRLIPYYASQQRAISLLLKLDADIMVTTVQDLQVYHMKRSYVRPDIEYIHIPHGPASLHLTARESAYDHFDTFFCAGPHQAAELRRREEMAGLPKKNLVKAGYGLYDLLAEQYKASAEDAGSERAPDAGKTGAPGGERAPGAGKTGAPGGERAPDAGKAGALRADKRRPRLLIAPSWQDDCILDICIEPMLESLLGNGWTIYIRPHPQFMRVFPERVEELKDQYRGHVDTGELVFDLDFADSSSIFMSDLLVTDWSGIAFEFSYCTLKPGVFVNTPMKVMNPNYKEYGLEVTDITLRDKVGVSVDLENVGNIHEVAARLLNDKDSFKEQIEQVVKEYVYYPGRSGEAGGKYIINRLREQMN